MWPWLTRHRRDPKPRRVTLRTDCLRYGSLDWVQITALKDPGKMGEVDAQIAGPNKIVLATQGVTGLRLRRSWRHVVAQSPVVVYADSARLHFAPTEPILLRSDTAGWKKAFGQVAGRHKRAGLEGPIRDAWLGPLVFTFGSLDPRATRANREVAEVLAKMRYPIDVRFKVISDRQVTSDLERDNSLVLVGNPRNHQVLARLNARLPIRVGARHVQLEQERFRGAEVGTIFVYPNPDHPNRYVVAVESPTVPGILRALSLPQLLPDFVVYDARLAGAAGEQVLGSSSVLAGGFFRNDWSLPSHTRDPLAAAASH
jgi:hypothetical protein